VVNKGEYIIILSQSSATVQYCLFVCSDPLYAAVQPVKVGQLLLDVSLMISISLKH